MKISILKTLNEEHTRNIEDLIYKRSLEETSNLDFPYEDEDCLYLLIYEGTVLAHCMALIHIADDSYEIIAFSNINFRHRAYFLTALNKLVAYMYKKTGSTIQIEALTDTPSGLAMAKKMELSLSSKQLTMSHNISNFIYKGDNRYSHIKDEYEDYIHYLISDRKLGLENFMSVKLLPYSKSTVYLYSVYMKQELRGKGYASKVFPYLLQTIKNSGMHKIVLQVDADNEVAVHLYNKYGFSIDQSLYYYKI